MNAKFWLQCDRLVTSSAVVIDRPKGSAHPHWPALVYPLDYGFLEETRSNDGGGVDVWRGSLGSAVTGAIVNVDLTKRDAEVKLLLGCTLGEARLALATNNTGMQAALLLLRDAEL